MEGIPRHSILVRVTHWINALSFLGLLISGVAILLAHPRFYWGEVGNVETPALIELPLPFVLNGQSGWGRYLHFLSAWICVLAGIVYAISGSIARLLPSKKDFSWNSLREAISNHLRRKVPLTYNPLQRIAYSAVVLIGLPLMIWTGFAMSPAITSVFPAIVRVLGGHQSARTIHFFVACSLVLFLVVHIAMIGISSFRIRMRGMSIDPLPAPGISRRKVIASGVASATGLVIAERLADRYGMIPPDYSGVYGAGETLTYAAQSMLATSQSLAREFDRSAISKTFPVNGNPPRKEIYRKLSADNFKAWRLTVDGMVARPVSFSLEELKNLPSRTHITHQACEEGWSFIAEWTGVPLGDILNRVGILPQARYVVFFPLDDMWDSLDMWDAWHPQTILAYKMNGDDISEEHGAPLRLRVTRQLGYKSIKYLSRIMATDSLKNIGSGRGSISPDIGYSWFAGI